MTRPKIIIRDNRIARVEAHQDGRWTAWWATTPPAGTHFRLTHCLPTNPNLALTIITAKGRRDWVLSTVRPRPPIVRRTRPQPDVPDVLRGAPGIPSTPTKESK